jgi:hypothetical protein
VIGVATTAAWVLAAVLALAGGAKLVRPSATADAFHALGVPAPRAVAFAVAFTELGTAALLLTRPRWGAVTALVLLALFTGFVAVRLRRGTVAACGCFGGSAGEPLSGATLVRNTLLAAAAAAGLGAAEPSVPALPDVLVVGVAVALGAVVHALVDVRIRTGRLWDNRLPTGPEGVL